MKQDEKKAEARKRLVLSKRVIKHLVVKSNVKTGLTPGGGGNMTEDACATRCCTNHNGVNVRRGS